MLHRNIRFKSFFSCFIFLLLLWSPILSKQWYFKQSVNANNLFHVLWFHLFDFIFFLLCFTVDFHLLLLVDWICSTIFSFFRCMIRNNKHNVRNIILLRTKLSNFQYGNAWMGGSVRICMIGWGKSKTRADSVAYVP